MREEAEKRKNVGSRRTCKLLYNAMFKLLSQKPFEDISVVDICEEAMVPRATFYNYFEDKYALLEYCIRMFTNERTPKIPAEANLSPEEYIKELVNNVCEYLLQNKEILQKISKTNSKSIILSELQKNISAEIMVLIEKLGHGTIPPEIICVYFSCVIVYVAKWWLETDPPYTKEEMLHYLNLLAEPKRLFNLKTD